MYCSHHKVVTVPDVSSNLLHGHGYSGGHRIPWLIGWFWFVHVMLLYVPPTDWLPVQNKPHYRIRV